MRNLAVIAGLALLCALPFVVQDDYFLRLINMGIIYAILAVSLNFVLGYAGQISLGHAGFFGIGAYTAALIGDVCSPTNIFSGAEKMWEVWPKTWPPSRSSIKWLK